MENKNYIVNGYYRTATYMRVRATSEQEAIEKAKEGDYEILDTEPDGPLYKPAWTAKEE